MRVYHRFDDSADECIERRGGVLDQCRRDQPVDLLDVPLMQRDKDRGFVGKILIYRTDVTPATSAMRFVVSDARLLRFMSRTAASRMATTV